LLAIKVFVILCCYFRYQAETTHEAVDEASDATKEAIDDLLKSVQEAPEALVSGMVDTIASAMQVSGLAVC